jgi:hypothetical protein
VDHEWLVDDGLGRHAWIERRERVLEDDLHTAAKPPQVLSCQAAKINTAEDDAPTGRLDEAQNAARNRRFTAAGFSDQPERFTTRNVEGHLVDDPQYLTPASKRAPAARDERPRETLHRQQRLPIARAQSW